MTRDCPEKSRTNTPQPHTNSRTPYTQIRAIIDEIKNNDEKEELFKQLEQSGF
jgi:hypothetical protein